MYLQHCLAVMIKGKVFLKEGWFHAPSTAFRHLPPNSARIGYPTEGALFISVQLSTIASALQKVWVLITLWKQLCPSMHINMRYVHHGEKKKKEFHLNSDDYGFCAGVSYMGVYRRNTWCHLSCLSRNALAPGKAAGTVPSPTSSPPPLFPTDLNSKQRDHIKKFTPPEQYSMMGEIINMASLAMCFLQEKQLWLLPPSSPSPLTTPTPTPHTQTKKNTGTKYTHFWGSGPDQWEFDLHHHRSTCGCWGCCGAAAEWHWGSSPPWSLWTGLGSGSPDPGIHTVTHRGLQALFTSNQSMHFKRKNCRVWQSCCLQKPFFSSSCLFDSLFCFAFVGTHFLIHISTANKDIKYLHMKAILVACGIPVQSVHDVALGV